MMYETLYEAVSKGAAARSLPMWAIDILDTVADGRCDIAAVLHPLGFVCLPLERFDGRGVCVHVWSDQLVQAQPTTSATHAHSWNLLSYVLYGALRNDLITVVDAPNAPTHRLYEIGTEEHGDQIRRTPRLVRCESSVSEVHRQGDVYALPAGRFHQTVPYGETATVALGAGQPGAVDLSLGAENLTTHRIRRQRCDREQTARIATMVRARLLELSEPRAREDRCEFGRR